MRTGEHEHDYAAAADLLAIQAQVAALEARVAALEPVTDPEPAYDAVFTGDPTGATDVTAELAAFITSGRHLALAPGAEYRVSRLDFVGLRDTVLDFRGAILRATPTTDDVGTLRLRGAVNVVLNDPWIVGTGYSWTMPTEGQHGFDILGGSNIVLNRPIAQDTKGDGIYVGYGWGQDTPATGVVVNDPIMERNARNGIAVVAGETTIAGGSIRYSGLHSIDLEPNTALGASTTRVIVRGTDLRDYDDIAEVPGLGYAVGGGWGHTATRKPLLHVIDCTGDKLEIAVSALNEIVVTGNRSDVPAVFEHWNSGPVTFSGNVNITRKAT